jgi:hypothetical protein
MGDGLALEVILLVPGGDDPRNQRPIIPGTLRQKLCPFCRARGGKTLKSAFEKHRHATSLRTMSRIMVM